MDLELRRDASVADTTLGQLFLNGDFFCFTLEDRIREVIGQPVRQWKIKGKTAIPSGRYRVGIVHSPKFGPDTIAVLDVPGFEGIRIHGGNTHTHTEGCPLVGERVVEDAAQGGRLADSQKALARLKAEVLASIRTRKEPVWLTIVNP